MEKLKIIKHKMKMLKNGVRQAKEEAQTSGSLSFDFSKLNSAEDILKASMQPEATSVTSTETPISSGVQESEDKLIKSSFAVIFVAAGLRGNTILKTKPADPILK